jgi:hypothetical protein
METGEKIALAGVIIAVVSLIAFVTCPMLYSPQAPHVTPTPTPTRTQTPSVIPPPLSSPTPTITETPEPTPPQIPTETPIPTPTLKPTITPTSPGPELGITVRVNTYPRTILAGESTEISVIALSGNIPVLGANVKISAGGGFFEDTGNVVITGTTNDEGGFRTIWHTYEKSAYTGEMSYVFSVDVSKSGYESGYGEGEVFITIPEPTPSESGTKEGALEFSLLLVETYFTGDEDRFCSHLAGTLYTLEGEGPFTKEEAISAIKEDKPFPSGEDYSEFTMEDYLENYHQEIMNYEDYSEYPELSGLSIDGWEPDADDFLFLGYEVKSGKEGFVWDDLLVFMVTYQNGKWEYIAFSG